MDKSKRILIFYASVGSKNEVAAKSLHVSLQQHYPEVSVAVVNVLDPVKRNDEWVTSYASFLTWVAFPDLDDRFWRSGDFQKAYQRICQLGLFQSHVGEAVQSWQPDLVVCTHALPASVLALWQADHANPIPIIAVATDYQVHPYWPVADIAQFIVPSVLTKQNLVATGMGMEAERIFPYGFPLRSEFGPSGDAATDAATGDDRSALVIAGGSRAATYASLRPKIVAMWQHLNQMPVIPQRWTFVVGNNNNLEADLHGANRHPDRLRVYGFVPDLPNLMRQAQVVVAKPGGLIIAETLAMGKPLVCLVSGSGQERANLSFLLATGAGISSEDPQEATDLVNSLLDDGLWRQNMHQRAAQWGKPDATRQITQHLADLIGLSPKNHVYDILGADQLFFNTSAMAEHR